MLVGHRNDQYMLENIGRVDLERKTSSENSA